MIIEKKTSPEQLCQCGCGKPTGRTVANSKYSFECKKRIEREQAAKYREAKRKK